MPRQGKSSKSRSRGDLSQQKVLSKENVHPRKPLSDSKTSFAGSHQSRFSDVLTTAIGVTIGTALGHIIGANIIGREFTEYASVEESTQNYCKKEIDKFVNCILNSSQLALCTKAQNDLIECGTKNPEITSMPSVSFQNPVKVCLEETNKFIKCITNIKYDLSECEVVRDSLNNCIKRNSD